MGNNTRLFSRLFLIVLLIKAFDVFKNLFIAAYLGVSNNADIYNSLINIPDSLIVLFGLDTIRGVVNSEYSHAYGAKGIEELRRSHSSMLALLSISGLALTSLAVIFSPWLIGVLLPGFEGIKRELAVSVSYIIFPIVFFKIISGYYNSVLNSLQEFFVPVIAPVIIGIFLVVSVLFPYFKGEIVYNLSYANLFGNILLLFILLSFAGRTGLVFKVSRPLFDELTVRILKASGAIFILVFFNQIYLFSRNFLASYFGEGAISALHYSGTVSSIVISVVFAVFFTALISKLSVLFSEGRRDAAMELYVRTITVLMFVVVPATAFFAAYGKELLTALYLRGEFDAAGLELTMKPYYWDVVSLLSFILYIIPTAYMLALKHYRKLAIAGSIIYALGTALSYILTNEFGFYAVSMAHFFTTSAYGITLLFITLSGYESKGRFALRISLIILSGVVTFFAGYFLKDMLLFRDASASITETMLILLAGLLIMLSFYTGVTVLFRINLTKDLIQSIRS